MCSRELCVRLTSTACPATPVHAPPPSRHSSPGSGQHFGDALCDSAGKRSTGLHSRPLLPRRVVHDRFWGRLLCSRVSCRRAAHSGTRYASLVLPSSHTGPSSTGRACRVRSSAAQQPRHLTHGKHTRQLDGGTDVWELGSQCRAGFPAKAAQCSADGRRVGLPLCIAASGCAAHCVFFVSGLSCPRDTLGHSPSAGSPKARTVSPSAATCRA